MKQYLRCLPNPVLTAVVHEKMMKCLELSSPDKEEEILLCALLLPKLNLHLLIYIMLFFLDVAQDNTNKMDSHNLSIVLAPNVLPLSMDLSKTQKKGKSNFNKMLQGEDLILRSNIDIIKILIDNSEHLLELSQKMDTLAKNEKVKEKLIQKRSLESSDEFSQTTTNVTLSAKKKRRSSSIHRLMTGLRKVVGRGSNPSVNTLTGMTSASTEGLDSVGRHEEVVLHPSPTKRKSDGWQSTPRADLQTNKRPRIDPEARIRGTNATTGETPQTPLLQSGSKTKSRRSLPTYNNSIRKRSIEGTTSLKIDTPSQLKLSNKISIDKQSRFKIEDLNNTSLKVFDKPRKSISFKESSINSKDIVTNGIQRSVSAGIEGARLKAQKITPPRIKTPSRPRLPPRRRSYDCALLPHGLRIAQTQVFLTPCRLRHKFSDDRPDGSDAANLGPRGIPDGSEQSTRVSGKFSAIKLVDDVAKLERQYAELKSAVLELEKEEDQNNLDQLRDNFIADSYSGQDMDINYSEMIQNAYEKIRHQSKESKVSPNERLQHRLGKELKMKRRSGENRVMRSPSERKIGVIRRRSRELMQNSNSSPLPNTSTEIQSPVPNAPKLEKPLMPTPVLTSLRRGKPNSVKSGLPLIALRHFGDLNDTTDQLNSRCLTPLVASHFTPSGNFGNENVCISYSSDTKPKHKSRSLSPSQLKKAPLIHNFNNTNLDGSFRETLEKSNVPRTRRRSSFMPNELEKLPVFDIDQYDESSEANQKNVSSDDFDQSTEWHEAAEFIQDLDELDTSNPDFPNIPTEKGESRPSIAALIRQKKVTENVQLFNNLNNTPGNRRRMSRSQFTPRQSLSYAQMTPHERLKAKQKSMHLNKASSSRIAVVSPLQENNHTGPKINFTPATPNRPIKEEVFKTPIAPTPYRTNTYTPKIRLEGQSIKPTAYFNKTQSDAPPKLPPRLTIAASPARPKYR